MKGKSTVPKARPVQPALFSLTPPASRRLTPAEWRTLTLDTIMPEARRLNLPPMVVQDVYQLFLDAKRPEPSAVKWWLTEEQAQKWAKRALNEAIKADASPGVVARAILYAIASGKRRPEPD